MAKDTARRILEKAKSIPDQVLFKSREFVSYITYLLSGMCSKFKRPPKVVFYYGDPGETAFTDGDATHVNFNCSLITHTNGRKSTREEKVRGIKATVCHEGAHIIYSPFKLKAKVDKMLSEGVLWPLEDFKDEVPEAEELLSYLQEKRFRAPIHKFWNWIENSLEDSYVDDQLTGGKYPVGRDRLWYLKKMAADHPTLEKCLEKESEYKSPEEGRVKTIMSVILAYAKYHMVIKHAKKNDRHEVLKKLYSMEDEIDAVLTDDEPIIRYARYQKILCGFWPELKAWLDTFPEPEEGEGEGEGDGESGSDDSGDPTQGQTPGIAQMPTGDAGSGMSSQDNSGKNPNQALQQMISQMLSGNGSGSQNQQQSGTNTGNSSVGNTSVATGIPQDSGDGQGQDGSEESDSDNGADDGSAQTGSDDDLDEANPNDSQAIEGMLKAIASQLVDDEETNEGAEEFSTISSSVNQNTHSGVTAKIHVPEVTDSAKETYDSLREEIDKTSKAIVRYFRQRIQAKDGWKMSGFYSGNKLSMSAMASGNNAIFEKKKLPGDVPKLSVAYLGDESGSMGGIKSQVNMLTAECIYAFCDALDLPVGVYGHDSDYDNEVNLMVYSDFRKSPKDKYRIARISSGGCNKDGYAIRLVCEKLIKQPSDHHVFIITSDGLPSAYGSRQEGIEDIKAAVREYSRKGVSFIAAAMDDDKTTIKEIYGNAFLDISDLQKMPSRLVGKLAAFLE